MPPATRPSTHTTTITRRRRATQKGGAELHVFIIALYDLPTPEVPSRVSLRACGLNCTTSTSTKAPLFQASNQKAGKNSFITAYKYDDEDDDHENDDWMILHAKSLQDLYPTSFTLELVYEKQQSQQTLCVAVPMNQLRINQTMDLTLPLQLQQSTNNNATRTPKRTTTNSTIQLQAQLLGPLRREIQILGSLCHVWFGCIDRLEGLLVRLFPTKLSQEQQSSSSQQRSSPFTGLVTALVLTPVVAIILMLVLPLFAPVVAAMLSVAASVLVATLLVYGSTAPGRQHLSDSRLLRYLVGSSLLQSCLYPVGPRPTPVTLVRHIVPQGKWGRLVLSLLIDVIGVASYALPFGLGELSDLAWAPLQTLLLMAMYDQTSPKLKYLSFWEELLPFTDFVPSATIGWYLWTRQRRRDVDDGSNSVLDHDLLLKEE